MSVCIISSIFYELLLVLVVVFNRKYLLVHGRKFLPLFIFLNLIDRSLLFFTKKIQSQCPYGEKVVVYIKK